MRTLIVYYSQGGNTAWAAEKIAAQLNTSLRGFDTLDTFGCYPDGNKVTDKP